MVDLNASYIQRLSEGFVAEPQSVPAARHAAESVRGILGTGAGERICLLVSELVSNAVLHRGRRATSAIRMRIWTSPTTVRVSVSSHGAPFRLSAAPAKEDFASRGWGLYLVDRLSDRWGVRRRAATEVWFEIDTASRRGTG